MRKLIPVLVLGLFLMACATAETGRQFNTSQANQFEIGKTTEAEVIAKLGTPYQTKIKENGDKVFLYMHIKVDVIPGRVSNNSQHISILFNQKGIVKAIDKGGLN